jgi:hypothetical protein
MDYKLTSSNANVVRCMPKRYICKILELKSTKSLPLLEYNKKINEIMEYVNTVIRPILIESLIQVQAGNITNTKIVEYMNNNNIPLYTGSKGSLPFNSFYLRVLMIDIVSTEILIDNMHSINYNPLRNNFGMLLDYICKQILLNKESTIEEEKTNNKPKKLEPMIITI